MGRTHLAAYRNAEKAGRGCHLAAVCDADPRRRDGEAEATGNIQTTTETRLFDPAEVAAYANPDDLLADQNVQVVSICTPTDTHVNLAIQALERGKHVLVEKPVALSADEVERLRRTADAASTLCMPAMCVRFWPGWTWLKERIEDASFGRVRSARFERLGGVPDWSPDFYRNPARSGGALFDLHIHDVDFIRWCFGHPESVTSHGSVDHLTTLYHYLDGPAHVVAEGGWIFNPGFPFRMRYLVVFDDATADFDLGRESPLFLTRNGQTETVPLEGTDGYQAEVAHLLERIHRRDGVLAATLEETAAVTRILEAEKRSLSAGESRVSTV
jgi:predicted dehydrogenase